MCHLLEKQWKSNMDSKHSKELSVKEVLLILPPIEKLHVNCKLRCRLLFSNPNRIYLEINIRHTGISSSQEGGQQLIKTSEFPHLWSKIYKWSTHNFACLNLADSYYLPIQSTHYLSNLHFTLLYWRQLRYKHDMHVLHAFL